MKEAPRKSAVKSLIHSSFPEATTRQVLVEEGDTHGQTVNAYLRAVKKARRGDCILLPPGSFPMPEFSRQIAIRAIRTGTVKMTPANASSGHVGGRAVVWLSGLSIHAGADADTPALKITSGTLILSECIVTGRIEAAGKDSALYLDGTQCGSTLVGIELSEHASAELTSSAVTACQIGISATGHAQVCILHSRIEGATGPDVTNPGAGLHGEKSAIYVAGSLIADNQVGFHLVECSDATILFSRFERNRLVSVMATSGGSLDIYGCAFVEQSSRSYAHITLEGTETRIAHCRMDDSALSFSQTEGGNVERLGNGDQVRECEPNDDFSTVLAEIRSLIGHEDAKPELENILHQAFAAKKRREHGLPVLKQSYHMVFEGGEGSGRREVAGVLANALFSLNALARSEVVEARMQDLMLGGMAIQQTVQSAAGGILLLHAPEEIDRDDVRMSYTRARDTLQTALSACGPETMLIFAGEREFVRPIVRSTTEGEQIFHAILRFPLPSPPELAQTFASLCHDNQIKLTTRASEKILLVMHILHDRRDKRFLNAAGVTKLFELTHKHFLERCSRERRFDIPLESGDIESPIEKPVDAVLAGQPAFARICPSCATPVPWIPGLPDEVPCPVCQRPSGSTWGIWLHSSHFRNLMSKDEGPQSIGLPPRRRRAMGAI